MIHTHYWPSTACEANEWNLAINQAILSQGPKFHNVEVSTTKFHKSLKETHTSTSVEIGQILLKDRFVPSIHFVHLCDKDIPEETRLTFPESILHLDILARLSQNSVVAVIDSFNSNSRVKRKQLESVTYVENTCTIVSQFKPYLSSPPVRPRLYDKKRINQLVIDAVHLLCERKIKRHVSEP